MPRSLDQFKELTELERLGLSTGSNVKSAKDLLRPVVAIIPAAGRGTRLRFRGPKILYPVKGIPILNLLHKALIDLVEEFCLVINPEFKDLISTYSHKERLQLSLAMQEIPTGMGDAVLCSERSVGGYADNCDYLIVWGDQGSVSRDTVLTSLLYHQHADPNPVITFPTCLIDEPYIHFQRDEKGKIIALMQKREGDRTPKTGETDCGVFIVQGRYLFSKLREHKEMSIPGRKTNEFNFLPYLIWMVERGFAVKGLPIANEIETRGINTLEDVLYISGEKKRG